MSTGGGSGGGSGVGGGGATDLFITPAGWTSAVWAIAVAGVLVWAVHQLPARRGDQPAARRVAWPFAGAVAAAVAWVVLGATAPSWAPVLASAAALALLVVAYDTALRHRRLLHLPARALLLGTLGAFTGWMAVAVPVDLAAALVSVGLPTSGAAAAAWQTGVVVLALGAGVAVVHRWRARAASTLTAVWALLALAAGAAGRDGGALLAAVAAVGAMALLGWAVWSRWQDLRRRVDAAKVRFGTSAPFGGTFPPGGAPRP